MGTQAGSVDLSVSTEDYLKAIYKLESHRQPAQTTSIADMLQISPPSVTGMVKRMAESGLVEHQPYKGVRLTEEGRRVALTMLRRHRILETYLTEKLKFSWDAVHEEAERLEHAASDLLINRMALALGNPRFDPHGDPIPTESGEIETPLTVALTDVPVGKKVVLVVVGDQDPARLRFIESLGLKPGATFEVMEHQPFRGPVKIWLVGGRKEEVLGHELAMSLQCTLMEDDN
jgi:DtxR family Mn-dependent transcriptional regulator